MDLADKKTIKSILFSRGLWAKKSLGQHFLVDQWVLDKIIQAAGLTSKDVVLEIGSGLGILTQKICVKAQKVVAVEKDERLANILKETTKDFDNLEIMNEDILKVQISNLVSKNYKLVANLPYNITSPVLKEFLTSENKPNLMVLMVQREVAERICSLPGQMSVLSVMVQLYSDPKIIEIIEPSSFFPVPKVQSAILKIENIKAKVSIDEKKFFKCVKIGFASRRKTLLNNLSAGYQIDKKKVKDILEKMNLKHTARAQELSIADWQNLANKL